MPPARTRTGTGERAETIFTLEKCAGDPEARQVGRRLVSPDLRQARETRPDGHSACEPVTVWGESPCSLPGLLPEWHLPAPVGPLTKSQEDLRGQMLLSLVGGEAEVAKAFSRRGGCAAVLDVAYSPNNDLSSLGPQS